MEERKTSHTLKEQPEAAKPRTPRRRPISLTALKREIDEQAHAIYRERIASHRTGDELSDWLEAEAVVKKRHRIK